MRLRFEDVVIDAKHTAVTVGGRPVHLPARAFGVLRVLAERPGQPVSRDELMREAWPGVHVVPNSVSQAIIAVRRGLAGSRGVLRIRAIPSRGYMLDAAVDRIPLPDQRARQQPLTSIDVATRSTRAWWARASLAAIAACLIVGTPTRPLIKAPTLESVRVTRSAMEKMATRRGTDLRASIDLFRHAIGMDRWNAEAYAGLAQASYLAGFYGIDDRRVAASRALEAASHALEINDGLARAYVVRASVELDTNWDLPASAADFGRGLKLNPADALAQQWSAWWCLAARRMPEARAAINRAVMLDPFSPVAITARATFAYLDGDFESALADSRRALQLRPTFFRAHLRIGLTELARGRPSEALGYLERAHRMAPDVPETLSALAHAYATAGRPLEAEQLLNESAATLPLYDRAIVLTGLGRLREAAQTLRRARDLRQLDAALFASEPRLIPIRPTTEFQRLAAELDSVEQVPSTGDWLIRRR